MILFDYPLNYGGGRSQYREVADNDYQTFTDQTSLLLNIDTTGDGTGAARAWTDIFVKGSGIASYAVALTNPENIASPPARILPSTVKNDSGDTVSIVDLDGFQNDLHTLWTDETQPKPKAKAITLTFTGTNVRVNEVMILNRILNLAGNRLFSRIEYDSIDLGSVDDDLRGRLTYTPPIGGERDKWSVLYRLISRPSATERDRLADQLIYFIRNYKHFVLAAEYHRYPERVFPAVFPNPETQLRYISDWKRAGRRALFTVREA